MERYFVLDKFNTWYDWRLILTAKDVTPPEPKTNYIELDGMSGTLDLSEALTGEITYRDRTVTASFWTDEGSRVERSLLLGNIIASLHGRKIKIIEPDDPEYYFNGRIKIKSSSNTIPYLTFTLEAVCEPWKYAVNETIRTVTVNGSAPVGAVLNNNGVKTLSPTITVTGAVDIVLDGVKTSLTEGSYKLSDIKLKRGVNLVSVSGEGSATFAYREAIL
jgi:phage-related protein